jgi:hypothetical protein
MKSTVEVKKAVYYGYSIRRGAAPENEVYYSLGFRPNGLNDSKGQFVVSASLEGVWSNICERREKCKIGDEFIITLEDSIEKYI